MNNVYQHAHMNDTEFDICVYIYVYIYIYWINIYHIYFTGFVAADVVRFPRMAMAQMIPHALVPKGAGNRGIEGRVHMPGHVAPMRVGYGKAALMKLGSAPQSETTQSSGFALEWMT